MSIKTGNKIDLSWDDINILVEDLCNTIKQSGAQIKSITGIERGGLIPAVMISHKLNIPYVTKINKDTLVVDDIADSGHTLNNTVAGYTATLYYKKTSKHIPDFYAKEIAGDSGWIIFPWEKRDSNTIQDYLEKT